MIIKHGDPNSRVRSIEVLVPCDCHTEKISISRFEDDLDLYFISFYVDSFYACQSIRFVIKERIKMAWRALWKGNFIHQEVALNKQKIEELRDGLSEIVKEKVG